MRARNIKPGFFNDEELLDLPPLARILFAGLWCLADREGRLVDRPRRIKIEVLPCDDFNVDGALQAMHDRGLICRYEAEGERYIQVVNFTKHQNPHRNEAPSVIPIPSISDFAPRTDVSTTLDIHASYQGQTEHCATRADSLIPDSRDSGFSDSLIGDKGTVDTSVSTPPKKPRFAPPSLEEVRAYCAERHNDVDPERWMAYYESNGWRVGKNPMKDWRAAVRTWERGDNNGRPNADVRRAAGGNGIPKPDMLGTWDIDGRTII